MKPFLIAEVRKRTSLLQNQIFKWSSIAYFGLNRNTVWTCRPLYTNRSLQNQRWKMSEIYLFQSKACAAGRQRGGQARTASGGGTLTMKITVGRRQPGRGVEERESTHANIGRFRSSLEEAENSRGHRMGNGLGKVLSENCSGKAYFA